MGTDQYFGTCQMTYRGFGPWCSVMADGWRSTKSHRVPLGGYETAPVAGGHSESAGPRRRSAACAPKGEPGVGHHRQREDRDEGEDRHRAIPDRPDRPPFGHCRRRCRVPPSSLSRGVGVGSRRRRRSRRPTGLALTGRAVSATSECGAVGVGDGVGLGVGDGVGLGVGDGVGLGVGDGVLGVDFASVQLSEFVFELETIAPVVAGGTGASVAMTPRMPPVETVNPVVTGTSNVSVPLPERFPTSRTTKLDSTSAT